MSSLSGPAIANYTINLAGAIGVKPTVAQSPKVLQCSHQLDELQFNRELSPEPKGIKASTILQVEESKDGHRDIQMSHPQETVNDQLELLINDNGQTNKPVDAEEPAATDKQQKKKKPPGSYYRGKKAEAGRQSA